MSATAHYAILDEAGDIGQHARSTHYLVGVAVLTPSLHGMQRAAGAIRKLARKRKIRLEELKARLVPSALAHEGLMRSLEWDWELIIAAVEKDSGSANAEPSEELYRRLMTHLVERCAQRYATLRVIIDKRYNNQAQRAKLMHAIETALLSFSNRVIVTLEQADSKARHELLIADYAAWAVFQKYERNDSAHTKSLRVKSFWKKQLRGARCLARGIKKRSGALAADSHRSRRSKTYVRTTSHCQELTTQTAR